MPNRPPPTVAPRTRPSSPPRARGSAGFTLVELLAIVAGLCLLVALALPHASAGSDARAARVDAVAGALRAGAMLVRAQAVAQSIPCGDASVVDPHTVPRLEGVPVHLTHCYPQATTDHGILAAAGVDPSRDGFEVAGGGTGPGATLVLRLADARRPDNCRVDYTSPASTDGHATVTADTSLC